MGRLYKQKDSKYWWLDYYRNGRRIRESSGTIKKTVAQAMLKDREGQIARGEPLSIRVQRIAVDELIDDVLRDYEVNDKDIDRARLSANKLKAFFSGMRALDVTTSSVNAYIKRRMGEATRRDSLPSVASINRELSLLKRAFRLAKNSTPPKVHQVPYVPIMQEDNIRKDFLDQEGYAALKAALPSHLKPILVLMWHSGWRRGECLGLKWSQIDLNRRLIRLNPGETKNKDGRTVYMPEELYQTLSGLKTQRDWHWPHVEDVFVRVKEKCSKDGKVEYEVEPIKSFYKAWRTACIKIGLGKMVEVTGLSGKKRKKYEGLNPHDLRRSCVRRLTRAGVTQEVAKRHTGHKTDSIFRRYDIVSEGDMKWAAEALEKYDERNIDIVSDIVGAAERVLEEVQDRK
jgi:integrase